MKLRMIALLALIIVPSAHSQDWVNLAGKAQMKSLLIMGNGIPLQGSAVQYRGEFVIHPGIIRVLEGESVEMGNRGVNSARLSKNKSASDFSLRYHWRATLLF